MAIEKNTTDVVYKGTAITLPSDPRNMPLKAAIETLTAKMKADETEVRVIEEIDAFVWDAAYAFHKALVQRYGIALQVAVESFFGSTPPATVGIEVAPGETIQVPWGRTTIPGLDGYIDVGMDLKDGRVILKVMATVKRKFENEIRELAALARQIAKRESIYRGKSFRINFTPDKDANGEANWMSVVPKFMIVEAADENMLVLPKRVENAVRTNLYTPMEHYLNLHDLGIPFKRGVLLAGHYGTGKTMAAFIAAKKANQNGITFILVEKPEEFAQAVSFARQYQPAVVFCEDIDRVMSGGRTVEMDKILNVVDGIDSKSTDVMVVLTTNKVDDIHQAMIRPGRLDAVIEFEKPDPEAVRRLLLQYAGKTLKPGTDLGPAGELLAGQIPAVVREVVERSKLAALRLSAPGEAVMLTGEALAESAETMHMQLRLLNRETEKQPSVFEQVGAGLGSEISKALVLLTKITENQPNTHNQQVAIYKDGQGWDFIHNDEVPVIPTAVLKALSNNGHE